MFWKNFSVKTAYYLTALLFLLIGAVIYFNSLNVPFYFDDAHNIENPALRIETLTLDSLSKAVSQGNLRERPVANLSFAFNYYIHGFTVQGFHIANILIHIVTAIALFTFIHLTLTIPVNQSNYRKPLLLAFVVSLLWLVHPLATQSVTYIVQRMNSMAVMFYLLSMISYIWSRKHQRESRKKSRSLIWGGFTLSIVFGFLAFGSKEIAATLPVMIFFYELYFFHDLQFKLSKKSILALAVIISVSVALMYIYLGSNPWRIFSSTCYGRDFTVYERLLTQTRVVMHYISLIVYPAPSRLVFDYNFPLSTSIFNPITTLYSFLAICSLILVSLLLAKREKLLSFCILAFFLTLVIESSIICLEIIFEHRTYLPSMFMLFFFTALLYRITIQKKYVFILLTIIVATIFGYWTYSRNITWQEPATFWLDNIKKSPKKARPYANLGSAYLKQKKWTKAIEYSRKALELHPNHPPALNNLSTALIELNQYEQAEKNLLELIKLRPRFVTPFINYANLLTKQGRIKEAISTYRKAIKLAPKYSLPNKNLGLLLLLSGQPQEAIRYLKTALVRLPESIEILTGLGEAYHRTDNTADAIKMYRRVLTIDLNNADAHYRLAILLSGRVPESEIINHYRQVVASQPSNIPALYNLANLFLRTGETEKAKRYYLKVISISPELSNAYNNLGLIYLDKGLIKEAEKAFKAALRISTDNRQAKRNLQLLKQVDKTP